MPTPDSSFGSVRIRPSCSATGTRACGKRSPAAPSPSGQTKVKCGLERSHEWGDNGASAGFILWTVRSASAAGAFAAWRTDALHFVTALGFAPPFKRLFADD